jgi:hypothetical protein
MQHRWVMGLLLTGFCAVPCLSQYRVLTGEADKDGCFPKTPARICLGSSGTSHCYAPPLDKDDAAYIFGLEPKAKPVAQLAGHELTLFTAAFSGCGNGTLTSFSLLTVKDGEYVNLLPKVELTNQSEFKLWRLPLLSGLLVLATADFVWDYETMKASNYSKETHFARHRYQVCVYVFDTKTGKYLQRLQYETARKYPGLDEVDEIRVLNAEMPAILAKLQSGHHSIR